MNRNLPIGRPLDNVQVYVLDRQLQLVPSGVAGEICIAGAGVGAGYLNDPAQTAERFPAHPFGDAPGARIYRTGDLGRHLASGDLEFLGRFDHQVKIRGFRIELGEIESCLKTHPQVAEALVLAREDVPGEKRLTAYVIPREGAHPAGTDLAAHCRQRLPEYMVPWATVILEKLPLSPHGKVDRRALPAPGLGRPDLAVGFVAPRDELELRLAQLWEDVLAVHPVGVRDNFFQLGGHSLLAVRLVNRIQRAFGRDLPLATLVQAGTVEALARVLRHEGANGQYSPLVPLHPHGDRPGWFCLHPVGGNVLCYYELAQHVDPAQPVYALHSRGLAAGDAPWSTLDEMVAQYRAAIQAVQPQGPYYLVGWSTGGPLACAVAAALEQAGESVALVGLIDARLPASLEIDPQDELGLLWEMIEFLRRFFGADVRLEREELAQQPPAQRASLVAHRLRELGVLPDDFDDQSVSRLVAVCQANWRALAGWVPAPCRGPVVLWKAAQAAGHELDHSGELGPDWGWGAALGREVAVETISGDHVTILTGEGAGQLAARLGQLARPGGGSLQKSSPDA
jgi:thioesterase domain-containing protein